MSKPNIQPTIQAVVVLYRTAPQDSVALCGLLAALQQDPEAAAAISVLVYDNSPDAPAASQVALPANVAFVHDPSNGGLLAAYNCALALAKSNGAGWLLLLDDDTQVTPEFVRSQLQFSQSNPEATLAAAVPKLRSKDKVQSPHAPVGGRQQPLADSFTGEARLGTTAFNSGAMLRRSAVEAVGGFHSGYRIDFLDHAMFARLARAGYRVWVLPVTLDHAMTWEDPARQMGVDRFASVLEAEQRFHREYGSWTTMLAFRLRCLRRAWRYHGWPDKRYAAICQRKAFGLKPPSRDLLFSK